MAFAQGLLSAVTSANEIIFWTAALTLTGSTGLSTTASVILVAGVAIIALMFDLSLACLATGSWIERQLTRFRRPLEASLGGLFWLAGLNLLRPI